jgi:hypothetical protein
VRGIQALQERDLEVCSLQEYHQRIPHRVLQTL